MKHTQVQMKGETVIELQGVKKVYPDQILAIDDISFKLERGKTLALVGPSGCGKSTTLKMINRLVEPTAGRILVEGRDVGKEDPVKLRRSIGYVIQEVGLFPHLTVEGNISLLPKLEGWSKVEIHNRVRYLLEKVRLKPDIFARRFPKELSGGQSQRVGVARALALNPSILLMDEPFGALDPIIRAELQEEFLAILQEFEKTIIFVTHDLNEALKMGDVIAIMNEGKIVQLDTPKNLLKHPIDTFVSDFIGSDKVVKLLKISTVAEVLGSKRSAINHTDLEKLDTSVVVTEETNGLVALEIMLQNKCTYLPVVSDTRERVSGLLTFDSIMEYVHR